MSRDEINNLKTNIQHSYTSFKGQSTRTDLSARTSVSRQSQSTETTDRPRTEFRKFSRQRNVDEKSEDAPAWSNKVGRISSVFSGMSNFSSRKTTKLLSTRSVLRYKQV